MTPCVAIAAAGGTLFAAGRGGLDGQLGCVSHPEDEEECLLEGRHWEKKKVEVEGLSELACACMMMHASVGQSDRRV